MRIVLWTCRIVIVLCLMAFAFKNTALVSVHFLFDLSWESPLVVVLSCFFTAGVVLGALALLGTVVRARREIARLKRDLKAAVTPIGNAP